MDFLKLISSKLLDLLDIVIASFFAMIIIVTLLQVTLRYIFNSSILGGNEVMEVLFIYTTAIGSAAAVQRRRHINISVLVEYLPPVIRRFFDIVVHCLIAFLNSAMIYYSIRWIGKVGGNESPVLRIPEWLFQISIPIGCSLVILYCLTNIIIGSSDSLPVEESE